MKESWRLSKIVKDQKYVMEESQVLSTIFNNLSFAIWLWLYLQPEIFGNLAFCRSVCFIHEQN